MPVMFVSAPLFCLLSFIAFLFQGSVIVIDDSDSERSGSELSPVKKRIK